MSPSELEAARRMLAFSRRDCAVKLGLLPERGRRTQPKLPLPPPSAAERKEWYDDRTDTYVTRAELERRLAERRARA